MWPSNSLYTHIHKHTHEPLIKLPPPSYLIRLPHQLQLHTKLPALNQPIHTNFLVCLFARSRINVRKSGKKHGGDKDKMLVRMLVSAKNGNTMITISITWVPTSADPSWFSKSSKTLWNWTKSRYQALMAPHRNLCLACTKWEWFIQYHP